jgi:multidrug efflux pump subunit AcrA (membrane-fusion protein)
VLDTATPRTRWYKAVSAAIDGDFVRAADLYAEMGSRPDEAVARLRAAEQALAAGDAVRARDQLADARAFFGQVGAQAHLREAETLVSASRSHPRLRR